MRMMLSKVPGCRLLLLLMASFMTPTWVMAGDGMAGTRHDFPQRSDNLTAVGMCTFCHTPHRAGGSTPAQALLWNHRAGTTDYTWSTTSTTGGTQYATIANDYPGVTSKCLSCHDGSVAIGDVFWFRANGPYFEGGSPPSLNSYHVGDDPNLGNSRVIGSGGAMAGNHPVAMPYPLNGTVDTYNGVTNGAMVEASGWVANPETNGIRMFHQSGSDIVAGAVDGSTGIECSSCHDPHNRDDSVPTGADYFLRGSLTGSTLADGYICVKCHDKG